MEERKYILTKNGLENFKKEYDDLVNNLIPKNNQDLEAARAYGDLSENSDYKFCREKQGKFNERKFELEYVINNCEVIDPNNVDTSIVSLGTIVTIKNLNTNTTSEYQIVDSLEVDLDNNKISFESLLGKSLKGKKIDDTITIMVKKPYSVKIIDIKA